MSAVLVTIGFLLVAVGFLGTVLPILPGIPVLWAGMLLYAFGTDFREISVAFLTVMAVVTVASIILDNVAAAAGAKRFRASGLGILGAFLGGIAGMFVGGPIGLIFGPFLGAVVGELLAGRSERDAFKSGLGSWLGFLAGNIIRFLIAIVMVGFFIQRIVIR